MSAALLARLVLDAASCLVVTAHPDDETLGAGALLGRLRSARIVHVTDGAPRDRRFFPPWLDLPRERYAAVRRAEALAALALAGIPPEHVLCLGAVDQEAARCLPKLVRELEARLLDLAPDVVITHPYEGGHPDHDATALAVHAAASLLARSGQGAPLVLEAASYHAAGGHLVRGAFIAAPGAPEEACFHLSPEEIARKRAMLACYASQREVVRAFPADTERLRRAPAYDFTKPPHEGPLQYERAAPAITGAEFRSLAGTCLALFGLLGTTCL